MKFKTIVDYDLNPNDVIECGFIEICNLLNCEEESLLTLSSDDEDSKDLLKIYELINEKGTEVGKRKFKYSILYYFRGIKYVLSYYEGGLFSVSFNNKDLPRVKKLLR